MANNGLPVERLRDYLRQLTPQSRALLIVELERSLLRADEMPGTDLVLRELRRTIHESGHTAPRIGNPTRLFFRPFEPFLVDDVSDHKHRGRLARVSLDSIWGWIVMEVMPAEGKTYADEVSKLLLDGDIAQAEQLAQQFHDQAADRIGEKVAAVLADAKATRRLSVQLGSPRALEDITTVATILGARDGLATLGLRLPPHIRNFVDPELTQVKALLDSPLLPKPELLVYGIVLAMSRLASPWQLIRLAIRAADSDNTARIADTPYAVAVTIVLDETERMVNELRAELKSGQGVAVVGLLKSIHDAARGLRTEMDLTVDSPWSRQLAAIRAEISELLKVEVEGVPGRVRRLLRPRSAAEIAPGAVLDPTEVAETEALIQFGGACRSYASELAISEMTLRTYSELEQSLDNGRQTLLDRLRHAGDRDRAYLQSQVEAAIRFCAVVFGADYAAVLAKAAEVAAQPDRRVARA